MTAPRARVFCTALAVGFLPASASASLSHESLETNLVPQAPASGFESSQAGHHLSFETNLSPEVVIPGGDLSSFCINQSMGVDEQGNRWNPAKSITQDYAGTDRQGRPLFFVKAWDRAVNSQCVVSSRTVKVELFSKPAKKYIKETKRAIIFDSRGNYDETRYARTKEYLDGRKPYFLEVDKQVILANGQSGTSCGRIVVFPNKKPNATNCPVSK